MHLFIFWINNILLLQCLFLNTNNYSPKYELYDEGIDFFINAAKPCYHIDECIDINYIFIAKEDGIKVYRHERLGISQALGYFIKLNIQDKNKNNIDYILCGPRDKIITNNNYFISLNKNEAYSEKVKIKLNINMNELTKKSTILEIKACYSYKNKNKNKKIDFHLWEGVVCSNTILIKIQDSGSVMNSGDRK